jgi:SRSO17 transposase
VEIRQRAGFYLRGLTASVERKNGWQLAEFVGDATPDAIQHFVGRDRWSADEVRDDLRSYVAENLGSKSSTDDEGVLIVDETGFLKKGTKSAGVGRMYSGTAGRIENQQIGVFVAYKSSRGHALVDRELYLPKSWTDDRSRCRKAKIPDDVEFATKPELAQRMLVRTLDGGLAAEWVAADEAYGSNGRFRRFLEVHGLGYVVAISASTHLFLSGKRAAVAMHVEGVPPEAWRTISCGSGSKGERLYDWAFAEWNSYGVDRFRRGLLIRRSLADPSDVAYYFTHAPQGTPLAKLIEIAGSRWAIEECFEQAKQLVGLDEYEFRAWHAWFRHVTLAMLAHATLAAIRAAETDASAQPSARRLRPKKSGST